MSEYFLLLSNPPHGDIDFDTAGPSLGLTRAELGMKANYQLPEIWFAGKNREAMTSIVRTLGDAGLNVVLISGEALRGLPAPTGVSEFAFTDDGLDLTIEGATRTLPYQTRLIGVLCRPRKDAESASRPSRSTAMGRLSHTSLTPDALVGRAEGGSTAGGQRKPDMEQAAFVDLYVAPGEQAHRFSFVEGNTVFPQRADAPGASAVDELASLTAECEKRFSHSVFDRRGDGMRIRRRVLVGEYPYDERRKGFSFATRALSQLLEWISQDLKLATETELASRLVFLTRQGQVR